MEDLITSVHVSNGCLLVETVQGELVSVSSFIRNLSLCILSGLLKILL